MFLLYMLAQRLSVNPFTLKFAFYRLLERTRESSQKVRDMSRSTGMVMLIIELIHSSSDTL